MVNRLQVFNRDILLSLEVSQELRTSMVLDVLDLSINSPQLIYDEEVNKRLSLMKQFLNGLKTISKPSRYRKSENRERKTRRITKMRVKE